MPRAEGHKQQVLYTFKPAGRLPGFGSEENGTTVHTLEADKAYQFEPDEDAEQERIWALLLMMFGLVLISLVVELVTTHIEKTMAKKDLLQCVYKLYKGMMMLGVMACALFIFKFSGIIEALTGADDHEVFDFGFLLLCMSLVVYMTTIICVIFHTMNIVNKWGSFEQLGFADAEKNFHAHGGAGIHKECFQFHLLRARFISNWGLRENFPFDKYLRRCGLRTCTELASIHWSVWVAFLVGIMIFLVRMLFIDLEIFGGSLTFLVFVWLTCILSFVMMLKSKSIWKELMGTLPKPGSHEEAALLQDPNPETNNTGFKHSSLFWGGTPLSLTVPVQAVFVLMAILLPIYFCHYIAYWTTYPVGDCILFNILTIVPVLLTLAVFIPLMIPSYVMARSVGYLTKLKVVNRIEMRHKVKVIEEEERVRRETARQRREAAAVAASALWAEQNKIPTPPASVSSVSDDDTGLQFKWRNVKAHEGSDDGVTGADIAALLGGKHGLGDGSSIDRESLRSEPVLPDEEAHPPRI